MDYGAGDKYRDFGELFLTSHDGAQIKYTLDLDTKGILLYILLYFSDISFQIFYLR